MAAKNVILTRPRKTVRLRPPKIRRIGPAEVGRALGAEPMPAEDARRLKLRLSP